MRRRPSGVKPVIRLLSIASSFKKLLKPLGCTDTTELVGLVQSAVGTRYKVAASRAMVEAEEDDARGGRCDDAARVREVNRVFADDRIVAAVALRGGAWLSRILSDIDFGVLKSRMQPVAIFGFSEISPLLNVAARYRGVRAIHDYCPGFLLAGMTSYARRCCAELIPAGQRIPEDVEGFAKTWAEVRFRGEFAAFFADMVEIIEGRGSARKVRLELVHGSMRGGGRIRIVGGNLTTIVTLLSSGHRRVLDPRAKWLLIEDVRETPDRIDRLLSHFSLSGRLVRYGGIIVGAFTTSEADYTMAAVECVRRHLRGTSTPILITRDVGHCWPLSPVPINLPVEVRAAPGGQGSSFELVVPWDRIGVVGR